MILNTSEVLAMNDITIRKSNSDESQFVIDGLVKYNLSKVPAEQEPSFIWLNKVIENSNGEIIAGINSKMYCWNCLYIDALWVNDNYRKQGYGSKLLYEIERSAKEQGCYLIHLDTFDFQAKDFYIKNGYEIFGILNDCPKGHKRYFLKKHI
jgi:GNAT superfamily N-acetyltransferase